MTFACVLIFLVSALAAVIPGLALVSAGLPGPVQPLDPVALATGAALTTFALRDLGRAWLMGSPEAAALTAGASWAAGLAVLSLLGLITAHAMMIATPVWISMAGLAAGGGLLALSGALADAADALHHRAADAAG